MTRRIMVIAVYVIAATIILLSGVCLFGLNQDSIRGLPTPSEAQRQPSTSPTQPTASTSSLSLRQGEARLIVVPEEKEGDIVSWRSGDESIVTVDSGGRIDGISVGIAQVSAHLSDGSLMIYTVTVDEAAPSRHSAV